jgi:hypothetical protein
MDFTKFASLLDRRALFFPTVEHLSKSDPYEGSLAKGNTELYGIDPRSVPLDIVKAFGCKDYESFSGFISILPKLGEAFRNIRQSIFVNCWHVNEDESAAMWVLYSGKSPGIAITSTYEAMRASFQSVEQDIYIGTVKYADYQWEAIPQRNIMSPTMYKRRSFAHENELRAVIMTGPGGETDPKRGVAHTSNGLYVSCLLEHLVEKVYVSPISAKWYHDLVESVIKKYGFEFGVLQSSIWSEPLF